MRDTPLYGGPSITGRQHAEICSMSDMSIHGMELTNYADEGSQSVIGLLVMTSALL